MTRRENDAYYTPQWCIDAIMSRLYLGTIRSFCEPAAGDGRIVRAVQAGKPRLKCITYDLNIGLDYLGDLQPPKVDLVISNPPYSHALGFVERAVNQASTAAMLLRLDFLGSQRRRPFWHRHPLTHLYVLTRRPSFTDDDKTDQYNYGWFVWDDLERVLRDSPGVYHL